MSTSSISCFLSYLIVFLLWGCQKKAISEPISLNKKKATSSEEMLLDVYLSAAESTSGKQIALFDYTKEGKLQMIIADKNSKTYDVSLAFILNSKAITNLEKIPYLLEDRSFNWTCVDGSSGGECSGSNASVLNCLNDAFMRCNGSICIEEK